MSVWATDYARFHSFRSMPDDETIPCVVCGKDLCLSVVDRHKHTNGCLDSEKSEALVAVLKNADLKDAHAESKQVSCAVCGRDLSSLTVQRRHVSFSTQAAPSSSTVSKKRQSRWRWRRRRRRNSSNSNSRSGRKELKTRKTKAEPKFANVYVRYLHASLSRLQPCLAQALNPITPEPHVKFCCNKYGNYPRMI